MAEKDGKKSDQGIKKLTEGQIRKGGTHAEPPTPKPEITPISHKPPAPSQSGGSEKQKK